MIALGRWAMACGVLAMLAFAAPAHGDWWERAGEGTAGQYWIKSDLPPERNRDLAQHLNRMYSAFHQRLGSLPQRMDERLNVLIFESQDDYLWTLKDRYDVDARFTGGVFFVRGDFSALAFWTESLPRQRVLQVLQHEAFHQFAYSRFGWDLPLWVNEGLAEFFGEAVMVNNELVIGQSKPRVLDAVRAAIEAEQHIPFRDMVATAGDAWRQGMREGRGQIQYNQAWSMVQFLVYGENGRYQQAFEQYLRMIAAGTDSAQAFARAFQTDDVDAFEKRWREYSIQARPSSFVTALERMEFLAEGALELSRRGVVPHSLNALRDALREIGFTYTITMHGMAVVLDAADDDLFTIPMDDLARQQPVFAVTPPTFGRLNRRQQLIEQEHPTPPGIATENLRPRGLSVQWKRDRDDNTFSYELIVR